MYAWNIFGKSIFCSCIPILTPLILIQSYVTIFQTPLFSVMTAEFFFKHPFSFQTPQPIIKYWVYYVNWYIFYVKNILGVNQKHYQTLMVFGSSQPLLNQLNSLQPFGWFPNPIFHPEFFQSNLQPYKITCQDPTFMELVSLSLTFGITSNHRYIFHRICVRNGREGNNCWGRK